MVYIQVPDRNDSVSSITLDEKEYTIRFTYNGKYDYWSFGIAGEDGYILTNTKIVPNFPLFAYCNDARLPRGIFGALTDDAKIGRDAFKNKDAEFVYIPLEDLEDE